MSRSVELQSAPWTTSPEGNEPVTLAQAKEYLRIPAAITDEDTQILTRLRAARADAEMFMGRALVNQSWTLFLDDFPPYDYASPDYEIVLPKGKCSAITAFTYVDSAGATQSLYGASTSPQGTGYREDLSSDAGGRVWPPYSVSNSSWPTARRQPKSIQITFTAGYGTTADDVPAIIREAILYRVATFNEVRGNQDERNPDRQAFERLLMPYRVPGSYWR